MEFNIYNQYGNINFNYETIVNDISSVIKQCEHFEDKNYTVSLILVDNQEIQYLNNTYRKNDRPTDVISFEADDEEDYLGDIFISIDKVYEQAQSYGHSHEREFAFLLCHGILHLLGYDHIDEDGEKEMFSKQDEILNLTDYKR